MTIGDQVSPVTKPLKALLKLPPWLVITVQNPWNVDPFTSLINGFLISERGKYDQTIIIPAIPNKQRMKKRFIDSPALQLHIIKRIEGKTVTMTGKSVPVAMPQMLAIIASLLKAVVYEKSMRSKFRTTSSIKQARINVATFCACDQN